MSLLGSQVFANPTTPLWGGGGGGGGSNFQTLNITQTGGNAGDLNFYKDASGSAVTTFQMYPNPASVVGSQVLSVYDASGLADTVQVGDLQAAGTGTLPGSEPPALSLGMAGTGTLGLRLVNTDVGGVTATYATFASNAFDLSNVRNLIGTTPGGMGLYNMKEIGSYQLLINDTSGIRMNPDVGINKYAEAGYQLDVSSVAHLPTLYSDISGTAVLQPKIQYGKATGATSGSGNVVVTLPQSYANTTYVVQVTMEDSNPAEMSANITGVNTFTIYYQSAGTAPHTLAWTTYGV
jgi:hypothetical protein